MMYVCWRKLLSTSTGPRISPAAGVAQESATQSQRECAFWKVADEIGIGNFFPRADLLIINGAQVAALRLLPFDFKTLAQIIKQDPNMAIRILEPYRRTGILFKWAIIDFVLGNVDRHGGNIMANPDGEVALIDHGSAFAGNGFDPAHDSNSFIPFYLRASVRGKNFNQLSFSEKIRVMPTVGPEVNKALEEWINQIDVDKIQEILENFGIDPQPTLDRLDRLKAAAQATTVDSAINQLWIST